MLTEYGVVAAEFLKACPLVGIEKVHTSRMRSNQVWLNLWNRYLIQPKDFRTAIGMRPSSFHGDEMISYLR